MTAQQLKNSILQMAVQGKLVPQDPSDEPASVLLERIRAEKEQLIESGRIKRDKHESVIYRRDDSYYEKVDGVERCIDDEVPFDIPESWEWVRWGTLANSIQYGYNAPAKKSGTIKMVRISDIQDGRILWDSVPFCDIEEGKISEYVLENDDILFARTGGTVGKSYLVTDIKEKSIYAGYLIRTRYSHSLCPQYLKYFMESLLYWSQLRSGTVATAQPNCNGKTLAKMLLPLPPINEQEEIVKKIQSVQTPIEKYDDLEFKRCIVDRSFPNDLKKSILQFAVQGKLVPQDPSDEPASVLLERIHSEKEQLIKSGKIKRDKHESVIYSRDDSYYEKVDGVERCIDDEIPFDIPDSWEWIRFGNAMINLDSQRIPLSVSERSKLEKIYDYYGASGVIDKVDRFLFDKPLLLIGEDGANLLNRSTPIAFIARGKYWVNNHAHVLDVCSGVSMEYITIFINSITLAPYITGTAQPKMNQEKMNSILIAMPPGEEQKRIIAKADQLLTICNNLSYNNMSS